MRHRQRGARRGFTDPPRARQEPAMMRGLPDIRATCCALCGWATTTTPTSRLKGACRGADLGGVHEARGRAAAVLRSHEFNMPEGVQMVSIDKATNLPSDSKCCRAIRITRRFWMGRCRWRPVRIRIRISAIFFRKSLGLGIRSLDKYVRLTRL
jgi:hypothetical protein